MFYLHKILSMEEKRKEKCGKSLNTAPKQSFILKKSTSLKGFTSF